MKTKGGKREGAGQKKPPALAKITREAKLQNTGPLLKLYKLSWLGGSSVVSKDILFSWLGGSAVKGD